MSGSRQPSMMPFSEYGGMSASLDLNPVIHVLRMHADQTQRNNDGASRL